MPPKRPEILHPDASGIANAAHLLALGKLVAIPTETVYGLAADARSGEAVARVYEAKGRPSFNPLIVHVADMAAADALAELSTTARDLAQAFWPGPLTLVLPARPRNGIADLATAGLATLAIRVPAHPATQALLSAFGAPIAAPSANPSGRISPTTAAHVEAGLGNKVAAILDAGPCAVGVESTILRVVGDNVQVLRDGGLPREAVAQMTGPLVANTTPAEISAPGQLTSHYAPHAQVELGETTSVGAVTIGFGPSDAELNLSPAGDLVAAAANLFAMLHAADALAEKRGLDRIAVAPVPDRGLGRAINDRLRRAAAKAR